MSGLSRRIKQLDDEAIKFFEQHAVLAEGQQFFGLRCVGVKLLQEMVQDKF